MATATTATKGHLNKIVWIYLFAFLLLAFSFHSEAKDKKSAAPQKGKEMFAMFETNKGNFKVKLFKDKAPIAVDNFAGLASGTKEYTDPRTGKKAKTPYYDGVTFHRIIPGFMIQGGDPTGTGTGGPGYTIKDEFDPTFKYDKAGIFAMAKTGAPDSGGSQFFVTVGAAPWLNGQYTAFGEVVDGLDVVMDISKVKTGSQDKPVEPVIIKHVKIVEQ